MKSFKALLDINLNGLCSRTKKLLKLLAICFRLVRKLPLLLRINFGYSDSLVFKKIIEFIFNITNVN